MLRSVLILALLVPAALCADPARAQSDEDLVETLVRQRRAARLAEIAASLPRTAPPRPPRSLESPVSREVAGLLAYWEAETRADSAAVADSLAALEPILPEIAWDKVEPDAQGPFLERYRETYWTVRGLSAFAPMDTVQTSALRAALAARFGTPTRNAAAQEQEGYAGSEYVQFEYWMIANDSIPLLVMDVDGPFGRGLILAGDETQTYLLPELKAHLGALLLSVEPAAYVDYFHSSDREQWYRTGYDGTAYFAEETRRPRWARRRTGQRWTIHR